jgi:hypothetical protein
METAVFPDVNGVRAALAIGLKTIPVEAIIDQSWNQAAQVGESTEAPVPLDRVL